MSEESKKYKKDVLDLFYTQFGNNLLTHIQECESCKRLQQPILMKILKHIEEIDKLK